MKAYIFCCYDVILFFESYKGEGVYLISICPSKTFLQGVQQVIFGRHLHQNTLDEITLPFTSLELRPSGMELKYNVSCDIIALLVSFHT